MVKSLKISRASLVAPLLLFAAGAFAIPYRPPMPVKATQLGPRRISLISSRAVSFREPRASARGLRRALVQRTRAMRAVWAAAPGSPLAGARISSSAQASTLIQWTALGPSKVGGRVNVILTNPANPEQLFIGTSSGGIWQSLDGGAHWASVSNFLGSLSVTSLVRLPDGTVLAGTGDQFNQPHYGIGILASHDGGITWEPLASTDPAADAYWYFVDDIAVNPNSVILVAAGVSPNSYAAGYAAQPGGAIYRSTDGGASFTAVQEIPDSACLDVSFNPNDANKVVAEFENGTVRTSDDAGKTWSAPITVVANAGRITLAWAPTQPGWVYAVVNNDPSAGPATLDNEFEDSPYTSWLNRPDFDPAWLKAFGREMGIGTIGAPPSTTVSVARGILYLSKDGGHTWQRQGAPAIGLLCAGSGPEDRYCQGNYDNVLWVSPIDAERIVAGGIDLFESADGGATWRKISDWRLTPLSPHADHHALASAPGYNGSSNRKFYDGDDGGMYSADDITAVMTTGGWTQRNDGLAVTEFYSVAGHAGDIAIAFANAVPIIGGTQDNGTLFLDANNFDPASWIQIFAGDGGFVDVDPADGNFVYGEYVHLQIAYSPIGGPGMKFLDPLPPDSGNPNRAMFIAPFMLDPTDPDAMFAGGADLWYGSGLKSGGLAWRSLNGANLPSGNYVAAIAVNSADHNDVWAGLITYGVFHSTNALSSLPDWQQVGLYTFPDSLYLTSVYLVPDEPNVVYVSYKSWFGQSLWKSSDGGASWTDISAGLPPVPVYDVTTEPGNDQMVFAATDVGLYVSSDGGATWSTNAWGPANVSISQLRWFDPVKHELLAASYGRGIFLGKVNGEPVNPKPAIVALVPSSASVGAAGITLRVTGTDYIADSLVEWNGSALATTYVSGTELAAPVPASDLAVAGKAEVTVVTPAPGGGTSNPATFVVYGKPPVAEDGTLTTRQNKAASGALVATDPAGDALTFSLVTQPSHGKVTLDNGATGAYTYTPARGYYGNDSFTFKANDGTQDSNTATIGVTVKPKSSSGGGASGPFGLGLLLLAGLLIAAKRMRRRTCR